MTIKFDKLNKLSALVLLRNRRFLLIIYYQVSNKVMQGYGINSSHDFYFKRTEASRDLICLRYNGISQQQPRQVSNQKNQSVSSTKKVFQTKLEIHDWNLKSCSFNFLFRTHSLDLSSLPTWRILSLEIRST